jgi:hypothetical protein
MPEILTKYPEIVLEVLKSGGAKCGIGVKQQILTQCAPEHFCSLPGGEICVYGMKDIAQMTQINLIEFSDVTSTIPNIYSNLNIILLLISCFLGIILGMILKRK